jgi:hypothetical protein
MSTTAEAWKTARAHYSNEEDGGRRVAFFDGYMLGFRTSREEERQRRTVEKNLDPLPWVSHNHGARAETALQYDDSELAPRAEYNQNREDYT